MRDGLKNTFGPIIGSIGWLGLICRCLLAVVFATAAAGKLLDLRGARTVLVEFGVPRWLSQIGGPALPVAELLVAAALIPRATAAWAAAGALVLLAVFIAAIARAMTQGRAPDCHCFGQLHSEPAGTSTLVRNSLLAVPAVLVLVGGRGRSLPGAVAGLDATRAALALSALLAAALAVAVLALWSDRRRLQSALRRAIAAQARPGLPRGSVAPAFTLPTVRGETTSLEDLLSPDRPLVLAFLSTHCGPCLEMLPRLASWQGSLEASVTIAPLFSGEIGEIQRLSDQHGLSLALAQDADEVLTDYALRATPSAVLIAPDQTIASGPAEGALPIEALIRSAASTTRPTPILTHPG